MTALTALEEFLVSPQPLLSWMILFALGAVWLTVIREWLHTLR